MTITVVIPTLDEARALPQTLSLAARLDFDEILVVDGGSTDGTREIAAALIRGGPPAPGPETPAPGPRASIRLLTAPPGRASQMNAGAAAASSEILVFLHADTRPPSNAPQLIRQALTDPSCVGGRFDVRFEPETRLGRVIAASMNWRSRWTGIMTGDQCLFVRRVTFQSLGGFAEIPLMEDIDFSRRLKRAGRLCALRPPVVTSYRRWQRRGPVRTILLMWLLRALYWAGMSPHRLQQLYGIVR